MSSPAITETSYPGMTGCGWQDASLLLRGFSLTPQEATVFHLLLCCLHPTSPLRYEDARWARDGSSVLETVLDLVPLHPPRWRENEVVSVSISHKVGTSQTPWMFILDA